MVNTLLGTILSRFIIYIGQSIIGKYIEKAMRKTVTEALQNENRTETANSINTLLNK